MAVLVDPAPAGGTTDPPARTMPAAAHTRWSEVVETSHQGLALLDADDRFEFASDRTAGALTVAPNDLLGTQLFDAIPELTAIDRTMIMTATGSGEPARVVCTRRGPDGWIRALRLTFVPRRRDDGSRSGMILLSHDITPLRVVQDQRRRAQHRLTAVEYEEQRRIAREIHDGPVQILAALSLRMGMARGQCIGDVEAQRLERAVDSAARQLREIVAPPTDSGDESAAGLLRQWSAPLIDGSSVVIHLVDRCRHPPNRATTEGLFAFLHEAIRRALAAGEPRRVEAELDEVSGGYQLTLSLPGEPLPYPSGPDADHRDIVAAERYAALLGGTYVELADTRSSAMRAFLPPLDDRGWKADSPLERDGDPPADRQAQSGSALPDGVVLSEADWAALAGASFEGRLELDAELRVVSVNESFARIAGRPSGELVGRPLADLFDVEDYTRLGPVIERVRRGEPVRFEWERRARAGARRWMQVAGSPRFDAAGHFAGVLAMTLDTTELHLAEDLRDAVLDDLARARSAARRRTAERLAAGPIQTLEQVIERLAAQVDRWEQNAVIAAIQRELERSVSGLRASISRMVDPEVSESSWSEALRASLEVERAAAGIELTVADRTAQAPRGAPAKALIQIAREALANAVRHGRAGRVAILLVDVDDRYRMQVVDDGVGVDPDQLRRTPQPLGTRSMTERAAKQNGTCEIESHPDGGTVVTVTIPHVDTALAVT